LIQESKQQTTNDVLGLLMAARYDDGQSIAEPELLDNLRGLLFAGHEATAVILAWICYWVHREPQVLETLQKELDALGSDPDPNEIANLPHLEVVCKETLRLWSTAMSRWDFCHV
jgi:cytochrome P450